MSRSPALATLAAGLLGHVMFGVFFGVGLGLGLLNAVLVRRRWRRSPPRTIRSKEDGAQLRHPPVGDHGDRADDRYRVPATWGLGVVFGLALFQVVLVITTALPVMKKIRRRVGLDGSDSKRNRRMEPHGND